MRKIRRQTLRAARTPAGGAAEGMLGLNPFVGPHWGEVLASMRRIGLQSIRQPTLALEQEALLTRELIAVLASQSALAAPKGDQRIAGANWQDNPFHRMWMQSSVAWTDALDTFVGQSASGPNRKERALFAFSTLSESLARTNAPIGNTAVEETATDRGGMHLFDGLKRMMNDLAANNGMPAEVDKSAFEVGRNIATSSGAVVFRNDVLELLQYAPATSGVHARPQLIVPAQVNKFYVFDIAPGRSIVEYLVKSGFQVFVVSWRNPLPAHRHWTMDTYVTALLEAIEAIREITGANDLNIHTAGSGAMTLAALLGHLAAIDRPLVHAATLMVPVCGQGTDSPFGALVSRRAFAAAKASSGAAAAPLEGRETARVFAWMRPNDLVWNYWVNNYLIGNPPPAFDILYWNDDTTRLPRGFRHQLLDMVAGNLLRQPGALTVVGTPIDLSRVTCDLYVIAGCTDHIAPWKNAYHSARAFGGKTLFVLHSGGNVQSLIDPPGSPKSIFYLRADLPANADEWLGGATATPDSWWSHWRDWLAARSGEMQPAAGAPGNARHPPGSAAPGSYVLDP